MSQKTLLVLGLLLAAVLPMGVRSASANANSVTHFSGGYAYAQWYQSGPCSYSNVYVEAATQAQIQTGQTQTGGPMIWVYVNGYNWCTSDYFSLSTPCCNGAPITGSFDVSRKATDASLNTTVDVINYATYSHVPLAVKLNWTNTSAPAKTRNTYTVSYPGFRSSTTLDGTQASAQATGSVTDDRGFDYTLGQPANYGGLAFVREGSVTHSS
jgi:hypothetical protein